MSDERLLVVGRDHEEIATRIRDGADGVEVRAVGYKAARPEDFEWATSVLAFLLPEAARGRLAAVRWIQSQGAGADGLLASVDVPPEVEVTRVTGVFGAPIADYVLARCLAIAQELPRLEVERREGAWRPFHARLLSELTVAVVGTGEIGAAVARRLVANGVDVVGVNRTGRAVEGLARVEPVARLREVVADVDALVLVVPRTATSERLVDAALLAALPPRAWLVNVARGAVVDEAALIEALRAGRLAGAALDVFEVEPLPVDSPLRTLPNVMVSPHVAGVTTPRQAADAYLENLRRRREGLPRRGVIDRERGY